MKLAPGTMVVICDNWRSDNGSFAMVVATDVRLSDLSGKAHFVFLVPQFEWVHNNSTRRIS